MLKQKTFAGNALEETISLVQSGPLIIDGCLFKILKLRVHGDVYVSGRKGYPCLNVQATCDGASQQWTYRFLEVFSMLKFMEEEVRATRSRPTLSRVS